MTQRMKDAAKAHSKAVRAQAEARAAVDVARKEICLAWLDSYGAAEGTMFKLTVPGKPDYRRRLKDGRYGRHPDKVVCGHFRLNADNELHFFPRKKNGEPGARPHNCGYLRGNAYCLNTGCAIELDNDSNLKQEKGRTA